MSTIVVRRSSSVESWSRPKLEKSIRQAFEDAASQVTPQVFERLCDEASESALRKVSKLTEMLSTQDIQDSVRDALMRNHQFRAAESYVIYRNTKVGSLMDIKQGRKPKPKISEAAAKSCSIEAMMRGTTCESCQ